MKNLIRAAALSLLATGTFVTANATVIARPGFVPIPMCTPGGVCGSQKSGSFVPVPICTPNSACSMTQKSGSFVPVPICTPNSACSMTQKSGS